MRPVSCALDQTAQWQLISVHSGSQASLDTSILYFSRLVLGVQLVLAGVQLPSRYLFTQVYTRFLFCPTSGSHGTCPATIPIRQNMEI